MFFEKIYVIGFGQIGKSLVKTLRHNEFKGSIFVNDKNTHSILAAKEDFLVDGFFNLNDTLNFNQSVVFLCLPPIITKEFLIKINDIIVNSGARDYILSDLCSVKLHLAAELASFKNYFSIHPMSGGDVQHIFEDETLNYIVYKDTTVNQLSLTYNTFLRRYLHFKNITLDVETHDAIVAITSHLANITECALTKDFGRLNSDMWKEIFLINSKNIMSAKSKLIYEMLRHDASDVDSFMNSLRLCFEEILKPYNKYHVNLTINAFSLSLDRLTKSQPKDVNFDIFIRSLKDFNLKNEKN